MTRFALAISILAVSLAFFATAQTPASADQHAVRAVVADYIEA